MDGQEKDLEQQETQETEGGPADLAEAFRMLGKSDETPAAAPVGGAEQLGEGAETGSEPEDVPGAGSTAEQPEDSGDLGGSATGIADVDISPARDAILTGIQREAMAQITKLYRDEGIKPITIDMLYERDEATGQVSFKNPDNPNRNFDSRAEAQAWVDAFNKQIDTKFKSDLREKQVELYRQAEPSLRILNFKATYDKMDAATRDVFEDLVEPYEIRDAYGKIVGYNCDLDAVANQAAKIAGRFGKQGSGEQQEQEQGVKQKQSTKPAMDMKTGASKGGSDDFKEPENIGEALKMFDKMNRKKD